MKYAYFNGLLVLLVVAFLSAQPGSMDLQQRILGARNKVMPALVHVEPVKSFYTTGEKRHTLVTGSGFIFSEDGYVLTNHHVVENAEQVHCTLSSKKKLSATIVGSDPSTDVAVLQLNKKEWEDGPFPYVELGDSDSLEVGQMVLALGSPLGLSRSVSMGVISSIDRYFQNSVQMISPYNLWIQTDAAINPGNSGGPLITLEGKVIGINTRGVFLAENLGFAIPINLAREVAEKLLTGEKIRRSWLGIELQPIKDLREYLEKPSLKGALISSVDTLSPAQRAGLKAGDVLLSMAGQTVNAEFDEDLPTIRKVIADLPRDQKVALNIYRKGKTLDFQVTPALEPFEYLPEFEAEEWGFVVKSITRQIYQIHGLPDYHGVIISAVKSGFLAEQAGLMAGDIIRSINRQPVKNMSQFKEFYKEMSNSNQEFVFFEVRRQGGSYFAAIQMEKKEE